MVGEPQAIPVGHEPPPLHASSSPNGSHRAHQADQGGREKAKGKPARRRTADRFAAVNAFLDFSAGGLSRAEALTWLALWRDTKPDGTAKTSVADVARRIGANPSTVKRAVAALVQADLLTVVYRGSLRRGPSAYRVRAMPRERVTPGSSPPGR